MSVSRPSAEDLARYARHYGFTMSTDDLDGFSRLVDSALSAYDLVEELYEDMLPVVVKDRPHTRPSESDNPFGAWYVRTEITATDDGPLAGVRIAVKDNVAVAGVPMMNGSKSVEGFVPRRDATVVSRLLEAGATIVGKSVCEDLCFSGSSFTSATGPVHNPWDRTRSAGGSSSGSGALVAAGEVDMAVGGDQGGSVRIPASFCGVVGHKPTHGLVPYTGAFPIERTIDHLGPITSTARDAARMLSVIAGPDGADPRQVDLPPTPDFVTELDRGAAGLKVGILVEGFGLEGLSDPLVDEAVRESATRLQEAGCVVDEVSVPWHRHGLAIWNVIATDGGAYQMLDGNAYGMNVAGTYDPELIAHFGAHRRAHADELSETVKLVALCGRHGLSKLHGAVYAKAQMLATSLRAAYDRALQEYDALVMPTTPFVATELIDPADPRETYIERAMNMVSNTAPFDVTGHPATSVPAGFAHGLPVGMMLVSRRFQDGITLRLADTFEQLRGQFPRPDAANLTYSA
ncbi:amidase [Streptomyces sp. V4I23]|uniref:amidase n=1 Tax=Streptomyces sp. V4I23 TaxID=3042282 RepID=UPI002786D594|nr:amidase [Streptomyces sp. V4I23]MDQ1012145.1 amidase [Streptomyces sp. V4I23]